MKKKKIFNSIEVFKNDIAEVESLLLSLLAHIDLVEQLTSGADFKKFMLLHNNTEEEIKIFTFDENKVNKIYELCFIRLYASFESFMYDFLRELYIRHPKSLPRDRKISVDDILDWKTQKSTRDFIIDHISIENSYDLTIWKKTLKGSFGLDIFEKDTQDEDRLNLINLIRNMILHSGRKFNSKISRDADKLLKPEKTTESKKLGKFEVKDFYINDKLFYQHLVLVVKRIVAKLEQDAN